MSATAKAFQHGIWSETAHLYRQKLLLILTIVSGFLALEIFEQIGGHSFGSNVSTIAWAVLAISVHGTILNGSEQVFPKSRGVFVPFLWRTFALAIPGFSIAIIALMMMNSASELAVLAMLPIYGLVTALFLSLVGTWLPAVVADGGDRSLVAALRRGQHTFWYTLVRLLAGCGTILTSAFVGVVWLTTAAENWGWGARTVGTVSPFVLVTAAASYLVIAFAFVMLPVILSRAYLLAEKSRS